MITFSTNQHEMLGYITERMEQLRQHVFDKHTNDDEHSTNKGSDRTGFNFGINRLGSLNNYVPKT